MILKTAPLILLGLLTNLERATAVPFNGLPTKDGTYTNSIAKMNSAIKCPNGIKGLSNGIALLVPGTALNGKDSFANGPFVQLLPGQGFDVCWVSPPNRQLADAQISAENIVDFGAGCSAAILQQERGSMFLNTQLHFLTKQIVPTTSIFTRTDEIVIPQFGPNPSSALAGSTQFPLQDYCSVAELSDHLLIIANPATYSIALNALTSKTGQADLSKFNPLTDCFNISNSALNLNNVGASLNYFAGIAIAVVDSGGGGSQVKSEPGLKQYVCNAGGATKCNVAGPKPSLVDVPQFLTSIE